MNKFILLIASIFILNILNVKAQDVKDQVFINTKDTRVIEIPEANRNFEKINYEVKQIPAPPQQYETADVEIAVPKLVTKINAVTIKPEPLQKLYGNYVKAGFGNYTTPYFEGFFNNKRSEKLSYGVHLKHFSSQNGPVKNFSGFSQNRGDAYVRYFTKTFEFTSGLSYSRDRYNFYGFNTKQPVEKDTLKQIFNTITFRAGIRNINRESKLNYNADFVYYNFRDHYKAKEDEYLTTFGGVYKLDSEKSIIADGMLSVSNRKDSSSISRNFFQIKPAFCYYNGKYKFIAGINTAYTNDSVGNSFHLYPRIQVDVALVENVVNAFAGMDGEMQKNTLRSFAVMNPYLNSNVPLLHSNKALELYAGLKGNYSGINYKGKLGYSNYKNLYFFNNSFTDSSKFTVLYDRGNTTVINIEGDVSYDIAEKLRLGVNANYYSYNMGTLEKPWHRPNFVASLLASYNLHKKIYINTDIYYISGLSGKNYISNKVVNLDGIFDVNLKVDYKFSNVFSAFLELNNILSKKYQRYLYYPVKGINVIGGISYSF